jgi:hypothetical protein
MSWFSLAVFVAAVVALAYFIPVLGLPILGAIALVVIVSAFLWRRDARRLRALAAERADEDIGSFGRSFRHTGVDMWIVRAVWDALAPWGTSPAGRVPLRGSDLLIEDLEIDDEDLGDLIPEIAARTGRSLDDVRSNPFYESLRTVQDLVFFLNAQPRRAAA